MVPVPDSVRSAAAHAFQLRDAGFVGFPHGYPTWTVEDGLRPSSASLKAPYSISPGQERDGDLIYYYKRDDIALENIEFKHVGVVQRTQVGPGTQHVFAHSIHDALPWYGYIYCIRRP